jgi:phenylalanyl-tRNA synthetase beta chain
MSDEMQYLRTGLRGSVLHTLASNRRVSQGEGFRLFEIGRVYLPREEARERDLPDERQVVVGVMSGPRFPTSWLASKGNMGFFDAKGVLEALSAQVGLDLSFDAAGDPTLSEGETATLHAGGQPVGVVGEVRRAVLERFDLDGATVALFEIDLDALAGAGDHVTAAYGAISRFPESERDLALIVDASVPSAMIQEIIERHKLVKRSTPFDYYTGEGIPEGKKSVAYRVVFQSGKGTLTADLVDRAQGDILRQLGRAVGAERRE